MLPPEILNLLGNILLVAFVALLAFLYFKNAYKLFKNVQQSKYSFLTIARGAGIFFPLLGVVLGLV